MKYQKQRKKMGVKEITNPRNEKENMEIMKEKKRVPESAEKNGWVRVEGEVEEKSQD